MHSIETPVGYRHRALICEKLGQDVADPALKREWADVAVEWHLLANRSAQDARRNALKKLTGKVRSWLGAT